MVRNSMDFIGDTHRTQGARNYVPPQGSNQLNYFFNKTNDLTRSIDVNGNAKNQGRRRATDLSLFN